MQLVNPEEKHLATRIGQRIKKRRQEIGMTQQGLADRLGVSHSLPYRYENGSKRISLARLLVVARILRVPISYFCDVAESNLAITEEEMQLLEEFRACSHPTQMLIIQKLNEMGASA